MENYQRFIRCCFIFFSLVTLGNLRSQNTAQSEFLLGGIQVNEQYMTHWMKMLKASGMNTVAVTVYAKQGSWNTDHIWYDDHDAGVMAEIKAAKAAGLKIVMVLRVALQHAYKGNKFLWHGMIYPKGISNLENWFYVYNGFVLKWANICQDKDVDVLVIGSEMNALTSTLPLTKMPALYRYYNSKKTQQNYEYKVLQFVEELKDVHIGVDRKMPQKSLKKHIDNKIKAQIKWVHQVALKDKSKRIAAMNTRRKHIQTHWTKIIKETREVYNGKLSYAANFDSYTYVGFWDQLDYISINAYFSLRADIDAAGDELKKELENGWDSVLFSITRFKEKNDILDKPVLFTELGYTLRQGTSFAPWKGFGFSILTHKDRDKLIIWKDQDESRSERVLAVNALHHSVKKNKFPLKGILYWKLTTYFRHLREEPFALHLSIPANDPLQEALVKFLMRK